MKKCKLRKSVSSSPILPGLDGLRSLWADAKVGDPRAIEEMALAICSYRSFDDFIEKTMKIKDSEKNPPATPTPEETKTTQTTWERAEQMLPPGRVLSVQGGLPSLGKRSK